MNRYMRISAVTFGNVDLPLPLSVRLSRRCDALPARGQDDRFATSVQLGAPTIIAEVKVRDTGVAESLALGQGGTLSFTVGATRKGQLPRRVRIEGAILHAADLVYEQAAIATGVLRFVAEARDGQIDPFTAEDGQ
jgi:hypothetical protein